MKLVGITASLENVIEFCQILFPSVKNIYDKIIKNATTF